MLSPRYAAHSQHLNFAVSSVRLKGRTSLLYVQGSSSKCCEPHPYMFLFSFFSFGTTEQLPSARGGHPAVVEQKRLFKKWLRKKNCKMQHEKSPRYTYCLEVEGCASRTHEKEDAHPRRGNETTVTAHTVCVTWRNLLFLRGSTR